MANPTSVDGLDKRTVERIKLAIKSIKRAKKPLPLGKGHHVVIKSKPSALGKLLCQRRSVRRFSGNPIPCQKLERLIVDAAGGVLIAPHEFDEKVEVLYRTIPQGGAIYSVHLSLVLFQNTGRLTRGVYKFCPYSNTLHKYASHFSDSQVEKAMQWRGGPFADYSGALLIISSNVKAKTFKYGPALGKKLSVLEAGCALQNVLLSICDQKLAAYAHGGGNPKLLAALCGINYPEEIPFVNVVIGCPCKGRRI